MSSSSHGHHNVLHRHRRARGVPSSRRHRPSDDDSLDLRIAPVVKTLGDDRVRMLAYNGSIPGPTLRVRQGSEITVHVRNDGDTEATVHWHGLRLDNAYDGVPHETQAPIPIGGEFTYRLRFPDAGLYWYHPHIREDYGLDMGLYGNIVVDPDRGRLLAAGEPRGRRHPRRRPRRGRPHRRRSTRPARPTSRWAASATSCSPAARPTSSSTADAGEVVRFYFTNTANTRLFNVAVPGARMKLVGGDSGRYEHETFVDEVLLAPSERAIVDVLLRRAGHVPARAPDPRTTPTCSAPSTSATSVAEPSFDGRVRAAAHRAPS